METLQSQHYEPENANKENSSESTFITKLGQSIQNLKENLKKFIYAPEEKGSGLREVPIEKDVETLVIGWINETDALNDEYELYSSSSGDSTLENDIIIPKQTRLTQVINEMKKYVESNNHKDTGSYVAGIDRIIGKMMRIARTAEESVEEAQGAESEEGEKYKFPGVEALDAALAEVVAKIPQQHNSATESGENAVELNDPRGRAQEAIDQYQSFHQSFPKGSRTPETQEQYRSLEKEAWDRVEALANELGGRIIELPRGLKFNLEDDVRTDIKTRDRLNSDLGYKFNQEGQITHIEINGNTIKLNRPRTINELLNGDRPARILYHSGEQILNGDPSKKHYKGYWIKGLNPNTIQDMERELSGNQFPKPDIIEEIEQPAAQTTEAVAPQENNFEAPKQADEEETTLQNSNPYGNNTKNNPEVSTEKEDPLESYRQQGFNEAQLAFIKNAIDAGDTPDKISLYAKSEYEVAQMIVEREKTLDPNLDISQYEELPYWEQIWIIACIRTGLNPEQIVPYLEEGISSDEIEGIQSDIKNGLTIEQMIKKKIIEMVKGDLNEDKGFSRYRLIEKLQFRQATQVIDSMNIDWKEQAIKSATSYLQYSLEDNKNWSKNELIQQLEFEKFTNDEAISAVNSITDYDWEEDSEVAEPTPQASPTQSETISTDVSTQEGQGTGAGTTSTEYGTNPQTSPTPSETPPTDVSTQEGQGTGAGTTSTESSPTPQASPTQSETISTDVSTQEGQGTGAGTTSTESSPTPQVSLNDLRLAYARAEEAWNRKRGDEQLEETFISAREAYNKELEKVLKLQVAVEQADTISQMFKDEVIALRDSRTTQSQELQGKWEKRFNNAKEKFLGWATKNKTRWMLANMGLFTAGALLSSIGVGIPVTGALEMTRRSLGSVMAGVGSRNTLVGLMEDGEINRFGIKFKAVIPKLVDESLGKDYINDASDADLRTKLSTLEAYYRLNGGKFTKENQQQAYEKVLTELARRVQKNVIGAENPNLSIQQLTPEQLEKNKELHGWGASYELAKIAKSQNIDLSLLSREEYADFAIQNKLMIDDNQLRMSLWKRMCESVDEVDRGDKERQSLINPEANDAFNKFSEEIKQKAGENDKKIDDNIIVKHGTNYSKHWLFFLINQGVAIKEDQIFKSYISLQDLNTLTPDKFTDFMRDLRDSGYNGDIKVFQDLLTQGIGLNDQIVMHGASEADAKLGLDVAAKFFGDSLADQSLGIDKIIDGKWRSHSKVLAQKIKNSIQDSSLVEKQNSSPESGESDKQYTSTLLNTISDKRIAELDKFRRNRQIANVVGFATTGVLGGLLLNDMLKPGGIFRPDIENGGESANNGVSTTQEVQNPVVNTDGAGGTETSGGISTESTSSQATNVPSSEEALRQAREATKQTQELAQDVSSLDRGETIWGEITKQLGENASQSEIQQAVENYLQSELGQESLYKLAQQTEGGREFLARWSIDNAGEMARLELKDLYEVSKYLGEGELKGLTELSLDVLKQVASTEFTENLSKALGTTNLTDSQIGSVLEAYADTDQGRKSLYELIMSNTEAAKSLPEFGVNDAADVANLSPDKLYAIAQTVGVDKLDKLPGFELNDIILSKFEDAPYMVDLARGTRPLDVVQRYIANELGNLPYDSNLGKQVLDTYVQTDAGKQWLYDAIVSNPNPNNQNVQLFREYLSYKGIKSAEDFKALFNWAEFSRNSNIPTSGFWNQIRLPNGNILQPLSTFLQPGPMPGINKALQLVLTK